MTVLPFVSALGIKGHLYLAPELLSFLSRGFAFGLCLRWFMRECLAFNRVEGNKLFHACVRLQLVIEALTFLHN
ncbi:hypothetical protein RchiOBHm_Chr1g0332311 [Rosa chinensis]|uniref:Uncharacterized protein n=1 Tax=Rosa chinensis TaxID=74649 RepID=A0A2P6SBR4_ROSCH|nr:hypothetical protein RchiOBHm_Chr1g0332311 [Rosa chinensis]